MRYLPLPLPLGTNVSSTVLQPGAEARSVISTPGVKSVKTNPPPTAVNCNNVEEFSLRKSAAA